MTLGLIVAARVRAVSRPAGARIELLRAAGSLLAGFLVSAWLTRAVASSGSCGEPGTGGWGSWQTVRVARYGLPSVSREVWVDGDSEPVERSSRAHSVLDATFWSALAYFLASPRSRRVRAAREAAYRAGRPSP